jgi:thioredoxin-related protein
MKYKKIGILFLLQSLLGISIYLFYCKVQQTEHKKELYKSVPVFQLRELSGAVVTKSSLQEDKSTLFLFFDPECDLCKEEFVQINSHKEALSGSQIVFFSVQPEDSIKNFLNRIAFNRSSNMFILSDKNAELLKTMNIQGPPTSLIYDKKGNLIKRFDGPVKIETLIKYLSEE